MSLIEVSLFEFLEYVTKVNNALNYFREISGNRGRDKISTRADKVYSCTSVYIESDRISNTNDDSPKIPDA